MSALRASSVPASARLLEVRDLTVSFDTSDGLVQAVRGVSFGVDQGRTLAIVGESGSGKSVSALTILGLAQGAHVSGSAAFEGRDLLQMPADELRGVRGARIAMIFQDPLSSLHPLYRVGWQIAEMVRLHQTVTRKQAHARAVELLGLVGIPRPARRVDDYPHQFSGGMRQRAMIAMALALNPRLLIADEPTTALDVTVQAQIMDLIRRLQAEYGTSIILITHDLGLVAEIADDVLVMYAGRAMEHAGRRALFYHPHHPYTRGLLASLPDRNGVRDRLTPIKGMPPSMIRLPTGCPFHPRCSEMLERCPRDGPPLRTLEPGHESACWLPERPLEAS
ncbi:MAG TPA: ABC transporter ATP-binding protein [Microbacteriaceae bacterium]|nr:ABC transporter ATP-binding protein [Microbacteriaceae bacterium]